MLGAHTCQVKAAYESIIKTRHEDGLSTGLKQLVGKRPPSTPVLIPRAGHGGSGEHGRDDAATSEEAHHGHLPRE